MKGPLLTAACEDGWRRDLRREVHTAGGECQPGGPTVPSGVIWILGCFSNKVEGLDEKVNSSVGLPGRAPRPAPPARATNPRATAQWLLTPSAIDNRGTAHKL